MSLVERLLLRGLLPLSVALVTSGCSWLVSREGPSDVDGGPKALLIARVDGTGSERPIHEPPPSLAGVMPAKRRLQDALVVEGEGLDAVTKVALASETGARRYENLGFERLPREGASAVSLRVSLPAGVRAGLYTLTLFAVADAASAQVYLLQGEPGPPGPEGAAGARGPAGVAAPAGLTRVVSLPPGDATCPRGGSQILAGTDRDGDGYLHDDEVETFSHSCHGDPGLDCADGACVLAADLEVEGAVYVSGPAGTSLPLVPHITTSVTFNIGPSAAAAFPTLQAALESLQGVRIALGAVVTLRLQAGEHVHAGALVLNHPDGRRIRIVGAQVADPSATVVLVSAPSATHGVVVQATDLGGLNGLTLRNASERGGHGVLVDDGRVVLGPALQIEGFDVGISAYHGAEVFLQGDVDSRVSVTGHVLGFFAQEASLHANFASATAPHAVEHTTGFHANLGGRIFAASAIAIGHSIGMLAHMQSVVHAPKAQVIGPGSATSTSGFLAQYGASIQAVDSVVHNVMFGYHAVYGGIIYVPTHGVATETPRLYCANTDSSVQRPGGPVVDCP